MNAEINTAQTRHLSWLRGIFLGYCVALGRWELEQVSVRLGNGHLLASF